MVDQYAKSKVPSPHSAEQLQDDHWATSWYQGKPTQKLHWF